jgi:hypothetical protein
VFEVIWCTALFSRSKNIKAFFIVLAALSCSVCCMYIAAKDIHKIEFGLQRNSTKLDQQVILNVAQTGIV